MGGLSSYKHAVPVTVLRNLLEPRPKPLRGKYPQSRIFRIKGIACFHCILEHNKLGKLFTWQFLYPDPSHPLAKNINFNRLLET